MSTAKIFIDESGFKSKSSNISDKHCDEFCVFVGVVIPDIAEKLCLDSFSPLFDNFKNRLPSDTKLHITDALASDIPGIREIAQTTRDEYIKTFKKLNLKYLFGAKRAYIEKISFDFKQKWLNETKETHLDKNLKISNHHSNCTLEGCAFESLLGKMEAFAENYGYDEVTPYIDKIDKNKFQEYSEILNKFRNINETANISQTAYNTKTKKLQKYSAKINFQVVDFEFDNRIADIKVEGKEHPLVLLADILANYTRYYMQQLPNTTHLHAPQNYQNFDLFPYIYGLSDKWLDDYI